MDVALKFVGSVVALFGVLIVFGSVEPNTDLNMLQQLQVAGAGLGLVAFGYWIFLGGDEYAIKKKEKTIQKKEKEEVDELYDAQ